MGVVKVKETKSGVGKSNLRTVYRSGGSHLGAHSLFAVWMPPPPWLTLFGGLFPPDIKYKARLKVEYGVSISDEKTRVESSNPKKFPCSIKVSPKRSPSFRHAPLFYILYSKFSGGGTSLAIRIEYFNNYSLCLLLPNTSSLPIVWCRMGT